MSKQLSVSIGQHSDKGQKSLNQDFHGASIPPSPLLNTKGIAIAIADGISSSDVSQIASESAITSFLSDYYCTSEAWSVKTSGQRVLLAINSWLHSQTRQSQYRYEQDRGYVCTFSGLIFKSHKAYLFHVGDSRIYRVHHNALEQLTHDHRINISSEQSYLGRALGVHPNLDIDYQELSVEPDDTFILMTDGVYENLDPSGIIQSIQQNKNDLDKAAKSICNAAFTSGSSDNLTVQIVRVDSLATQNADELYQQLTQLPFAPELKEKDTLDGYVIIRKLHASARSHVYLARDNDTQSHVVIKTPSVDMRGDPAYLERFLMEEWIGRRIDNVHVLKCPPQQRKRHYFYVITEYIEGQTLEQWMTDNPKPEIESVRSIIEQIAKGLRSFHRLEMFHQDIRPANIMIDTNGTVKIIDFGSTLVAGLLETVSPLGRQHILGTAQYTAPEYFIGDPGSPSSDQFSLGVITYQMLTGKLPYGATVARIKTRADQKRLNYNSMLNEEKPIPAWIDHAIKKAVHPNPYKRYEELTEFIYDLRNPNPKYLSQTKAPLIERNPLLFWKSLSFILFVIVVWLLADKV